MEYFNDESKSFLTKYVDSHSPSGFETEAQKVWMDYIKPYVDEVYIDHYGTAVGVINPHLADKYKVMVESHVDEIGWSVKYISSDGLIYVEKIGSPDVLLAPGQRVNIHTSKGDIRGVFGFPALHLREADKKILTSGLTIDVGCISKSKTESLGISIGDPITSDNGCEFIGDGKIVSRALDNKIGGFALAQLLKKIYDEDTELDFCLYVTNSTQEEVGKHGATMIVDKLKPNMAIVTDVTHDTSTPGIVERVKGDFKITRGPVINSSPLIHKGLLKIVRDIADKNKIKYQMKAGVKKTGTDADVIAISNGGTPTVLISTPIRYMHTPNEICSTGDVNRLIDLIHLTLIEVSDDNLGFKTTYYRSNS